MTPSSKKTRGRPLKGDAPRVRVSFTLPEPIYFELREQAEQSSFSASEIVERSLKEVSSGAQDAAKILVEYSRIRKQIDKIADTYHIKRLSLFGSTLQGFARVESDIDILVENIEPHSLSLFELAELESKLSMIFGGRKVDLRTINELSRYFRDDVLQEAVEIYGK